MEQLFREFKRDKCTVRGTSAYCTYMGLQAMWAAPRLLDLCMMLQSVMGQQWSPLAELKHYRKPMNTNHVPHSVVSL